MKAGKVNLRKNEYFLNSLTSLKCGEEVDTSTKSTL